MNDFVAELVEALARQKAADQRQSDIEGGYYTFDVFAPIDKAGEAVIPVSFPVRYVEKPIFTFGAELGAGYALTPGAFPFISAVIQSWKFGRRDDSGAKFYDGCSVVVVASSSIDMGLIFHLSFRGRSVRNVA